MSYGKKVYEEAKKELDRRRLSAEETASETRREFYARCPRAEEVKAAMAANAAGAARALLGGGNAREELERLHARAAELSAEYDGLLKEHSLTREDVSPRYACEKCHDTGIYEGKMCQCLRQLERSIAYRELSMSAPLDNSTFDNFSLDYYEQDERAHRQMANILNACRDYAANFRANSPSLLFRGGTGLGKTHLSLAIAGAAIEKGFGVVYGSAQSFAVSLEKERFDREGDDEDSTNGQLISCDLLILDDLGTEFSSAYVNAALYHVINARMLAGKPTIISTNLSLKELESRYSERFASRIAGGYGMMEFLGSDVRVQKRRGGRKN